MNFVRNVVGQRAPQDLAIVTLARDGTRREWTFGELLRASGSLAGAYAEQGVQRGSTVLTLVGSTIEYVLAILAGLRIGAATLPCSEQLRAGDVALRLRRARPALVLCDERNRAAVDAALAMADVPRCPVLAVPDAALHSDHPAPPFADLGPLDPSFVLFTSGTSGEPKLVTHGQRYVTGQQLQAREWMAARPGELVWSTAAPGWSKSARNSFIAPWLGGAAALLHDERFDAVRRLEIVRSEQVNVLCMAATEYRLIAAHGPIGALPSLRRAITAGEPLGISAFEAWRTQTGIAISDGYGQTETGQVTGVRPGESAPPGSMGRALPGIVADVVDGELVLDPGTVPTFFLGYDGDGVPQGMWRTGDQVRRDDDGWLFFEARTDDVIISAGYRVGPAEVESTLVAHPAVRECAVLGVPDEARGHVIGAAVVLQDGYAGTPELIAELQRFVRTETAPYKYPRRVWFVAELPKTTSGKIHRAALRAP